MAVSRYHLHKPQQLFLVYDNIQEGGRSLKVCWTFHQTVGSVMDYYCLSV